jgi:hypothetical protein
MTITRLIPFGVLFAGLGARPGQTALFPPLLGHWLPEKVANGFQAAPGASGSPAGIGGVFLLAY